MFNRCICGIEDNVRGGGRAEGGTYCFVRPHGEQVRHEGGKPPGDTALGDEAEFELGQAHGTVPDRTVPTGNV